jgi:hypothetical protein
VKNVLCCGLTMKVYGIVSLTFRCMLGMASLFKKFPLEAGKLRLCLSKEIAYFVCDILRM